MRQNLFWLTDEQCERTHCQCKKDAAPFGDLLVGVTSAVDGPSLRSRVQTIELR